MAKESANAGDSGDSKKVLKKEIEEREKLKKIRDKEHQKKLKAEKKRIKKVVSYPSKTLFKATLIVFFVAFLFYYIGEQASLIFSVYSSFILYSAITAISTVIMVTAVVIAAERRKAQISELKRIQLEKKEAEETKRQTEKQRIEDELRAAEGRRRQDRASFSNQNEDFFNVNNNVNNDFNSINLPDNFGGNMQFEGSPLQAR